MYRIAKQSDMPGILSLWEEAFGDTPEAVMVFFAAFPHCRSYVAEEDEKILSMVHAIPQTLSPDYPAVYLYAVATDKAFRGKGICRNLMAFAEADLKKQGFIACVLTPASDTLFHYYKNLGYETAFFRHATPFSGGIPISLEEYAAKREALLTLPHMIYDETFLQYAKNLYELTFYRTENGIAAASKQGTLECLPEDVGGTPFAMIKWLSHHQPMKEAYLGIALK